MQGFREELGHDGHAIADTLAIARSALESVPAISRPRRIDTNQGPAADSWLFCLDEMMEHTP
jgi:hypothetical protein